MLEAGGSRMKFLLDQRLKHRVIGGVVIASLAAVFLPAMMKQSNYRFDQSTSVAIRLPPKPVAPKVAVKDEKQLFSTVNTPKVSIPKVTETAQLPTMIHAESISSAAKIDPVLAKHDLVSSPAVTKVAAAPVPAAPKPKAIVAKKIGKKAETVAVKSVQKGAYVVQLASFTQQNNAKLLVNKLRSKGYNANYLTSASKSGSIYKVVVGGLKHREEALNLQKKLASSLQLNGFVIKTGVS